MKTPLNKNIIFIYIVSAGLFIYSVNNLFDWKFDNYKFGKAEMVSNLDTYAKSVVEKCVGVKYKPTCYEEEIPNLMKTISMEDAFQATRLIQEKDPSYTYCHVLGHKLSAQETAKDPSKWKEVVTRCPSGLCSNGCIHGAFQERFRSETLNDEDLAVLEEDLKVICEPKKNWNPTGLEQGTCYHALGHLLMYVTGADIDKSTKICEKVGIKPDGRNWSKLCFDGAFMQIFQPLEDEDFILVKGKQPKKEDLSSFCEQYDGQRKVACWGEGWPLYFEDLLKPEGLVKYCSKSILTLAIEQDQCYSGLFYVMTAQFKFDLSKISNYCLGLPQLRADQCFANAASRLIETDYRNISKVIDFCDSTSRESIRDACYFELIKYSTYNFHIESQEYYQLFNSFPEPFKDQCLNTH